MSTRTSHGFDDAWVAVIQVVGEPYAARAELVDHGLDARRRVVEEEEGVRHRIDRQRIGVITCRISSVCSLITRQVVEPVWFESITNNEETGIFVQRKRLA
jgi:hypothetical protein